MLQVIVSPNDKYSMAEVAQMAIEAGCQWIQIHAPELSDEDLRPEAAEITALCRETATILTIENRTELARELGVHGIYIGGNEISPQKLREEMGPEAIIGMEVSTSTTAVGLEKSDIDYAVVAPMLDNGAKDRLVREIRSIGSKMPLVARGRFSSADIHELLQTGYSGICTRVDLAGDPISHTAELIAALARG